MTLNFANIKKMWIDGNSVKKITDMTTGKVIWSALSKVLKSWQTLIQPLTCDGSVAGDFESVEVYGESVQERLSKNLFDEDTVTSSSHFNSTSNGFEIISNSIDFYLKGAYEYNGVSLLDLKAGNYIASCTNPKVKVTFYYCKTDATSNSDLGGLTSGANATTVTEDSRIVGIRIRSTDSSATTLAGEVFKVQLEEGNTATAYEPYGAIITTPTPSTPIPIESVGSLSPNLIQTYDDAIKSSDGLTGTKNGITWTKNADGSVTLNGTATAMTDIYLEGATGLNSATYPCVRKAGTYTAKAFSNTSIGLKSGSVTLYIVWYNSNEAGIISRSISSSDFTFELSEDTVYCRTFIRTSQDTICNNLTVYPMVVEGDTVGDFEQYGKYKVPVTVSSKNLFDISNKELGYYYDVNGTRVSSSYTCNSRFIEANPNTTYTLTFFDGSGSSRSDTKRAHLFNKNNTWIKQVASKVVGVGVYNSFSFTTTEDTAYICFTLGNDDINIQLEQGNTATSYVPYSAPVTTNIYLDEPIRKVESYADTITCTPKSENLCNENVFEYKSYQNDGSLVASIYRIVYDYYEASPLTTYYADVVYNKEDFGGETLSNIWTEFDENKNFIKRTFGGVKITTSENTKYIRFGISRATAQQIDQTKIKVMLTEGSTATSYVPYGPVATVTRNLKPVQAESLTWEADSSRCYSVIADIFNVGSKRVADILAEQYKADTKGSLNTTFHYSNQIYCYKEDLTVNPEGEFIYPLATPTTETISLPDTIKAIDGTSIINIDTTISPSKVAASEYVEQ